MKTPVHRDTRLDELDARAFEEMLTSKSWRIYTARVSLMFQVSVGHCVTSADERVLRQAQGAAEALRSVLAVPETLLAEMKKPARKAE